MMTTKHSNLQQGVFATGLLLLIMTHNMALAANTPPQAHTPMDIIVAVEDSTAMEQRDPNGSHKLAIKMLLSLLNNDDRAAMLKFNNTAEVQSGLLSLDSEKTANQLFSHIDQISGKQTSVNVHQALLATKQLIEKSPSPEERDVHVILFASGQATSSREDESTNNEDEAMSQLLLWFKTAFIPVHVVTFNNPANEATIKNITASTHGTLTISKSGQPLQSAVLGLGRTLGNESIVYVDDEPTWRVDDSMDHFKLLITPGGADISLLTPEKKLIESTATVEGISWRATEEFTAIAVSKPEPGTWQIKSSNLARHKVTMQYPSVFDLGYALQRDVIKAGEKTKLSAWLQKNNEPVTDSDVVQFLKVRLSILRNQEVIDDSSLFPDPQKPSRFFTYIQLDEAGDYDFQLTMEDNNLYREARFTRNIGSVQLAQPAQQAQAPATPNAEKQSTAAKPAKEKPEQPAIARDTDSGESTSVFNDMPSLNKALMIAIIFNALLIAIGGLMYYRRKMNQQTINTLELMKYGNGKDKGKDKKHEIDFNNAAA